MHADAAAVLDFWFGPPGPDSVVAGRQRQRWFGKSPEFDRSVTTRFAATLEAAAAGRLNGWAASPRGRLALVIVLDQFPHHVYRGRREAFATDQQAQAASLAALDAGEDELLAPIERVFLYLPLEHAESPAMQSRSVALFDALACSAAADARAVFENFLDYARKHRDVVTRFGRFPHRNAMLGRASTPEEIEFLKQPGARF